MNFLSALAWADLAIILAGALLGGFITGFAGFGAGLVASGFWFLALPAPMVPPMIVIASVAGQVVSLARVRHAFAWSRALPFLVPGLLAVPVGIYALTQSSPATLRFSVGAFLIAYALFNLFGLARWSIGNKGGRTADAAIGAAGGFLGGFAGLSGPVPLIWLQLRGGSSVSQRAVYQPFNFIVLVLAGVGMLIGGQIDAQVAVLAAACLPFTFAGAAIVRSRAKRFAATTPFPSPDAVPSTRRVHRCRPAG